MIILDDFHQKIKKNKFIIGLNNNNFPQTKEKDKRLGKFSVLALKTFCMLR